MTAKITAKLAQIKKDFPTFDFKDGGLYGDNYGYQITVVTPHYFLSIHDWFEHGKEELLVVATSRQSNVHYTQYHTDESIKRYLTSVMILGI